MAWVYCPRCRKKRNMKADIGYCPSCRLFGFVEDGVLIEQEDEYDFGEDYDEIPECCAACGGDYPNCTDGCPMFDD